MRREKTMLSDKLDERLAYLAYTTGGTNASERERMKRLLYRAIRIELTGRQRECLEMYYLHGIRMREISQRLGLHPSTVSRHIKTAKAKLKRIADYYETRKKETY